MSSVRQIRERIICRRAVYISYYTPILIVGRLFDFESELATIRRPVDRDVAVKIDLLALIVYVVAVDRLQRGRQRVASSQCRGDGEIRRRALVTIDPQRISTRLI